MQRCQLVWCRQPSGELVISMSLVDSHWPPQDICVPPWQKGPSDGIFISKKICSYKAVQIFRNFFYMNLLINVVYYVYIELYIRFYIPNQAIRVAKLCFYLFFFFKKTAWTHEVTWPWALIIEEFIHISVLYSHTKFYKNWLTETMGNPNFICKWMQNLIINVLNKVSLS